MERTTTRVSDYLWYEGLVAEKVKPLKERSHELMRVQPGHRVLDVGCGSGVDTVALGHLVGPTGLVVGVDVDNEMLVIARAMAGVEGVADWVVHRRADARALPYGWGYFDACRSERLCEHVSHPRHVISEMVRVTKPGGWIVIADTDWSTLSIDSCHGDVERRLLEFGIDRLASGYAGRQLFGLLRRRGLADVVIEIFPICITDYGLACYMGLLDESPREAVEAGIVTTGELERRRLAFEEADEVGAFFASVNLVMVAGRKPQRSDPRICPASGH